MLRDFPCLVSPEKSEYEEIIIRLPGGSKDSGVKTPEVRLRQGTSELVPCYETFSSADEGAASSAPTFDAHYFVASGPFTDWAY